MILSDRQIRARCGGKNPMIVPFEEGKVRRCISYGLSSYGYDIRVSDRFLIMDKGIDGFVIDPKNFDPSVFTEVRGDHCLIPPHTMALAKTIEVFNIPRDILTVCLGKSTYARCGIILNVTPFEPEWEGVATLEITNCTPYPAKIYANEGIGQILFLRADKECQVSYADKKGRYQAQEDIVYARGA